MLFERDRGNIIAHLYPDLAKLLKESEFTTTDIAGNQDRPLAGATSMFQINTSTYAIEIEIEKAETFWQNTLNTVKKAASGVCTKSLRDFTEERNVHLEFQKMGAVIMTDYLVLGLVVHLYDNDPTMLQKMKDYLTSL